MLPCPPHEALQRLLDDRLSEVERPDVEAHVEACAACQARLTDLTTADVPRPARASPAPTLEARDEEALRHIKEVSPRPRRPGERSAWPEIPGYEILGELGRGGMGVVYKACQLKLNRIVALKMMRWEHARPEELLRFQVEAELAARLQHPNIVQLHEVGAHDGRPYLALEYVEGGTLADQLDGTPRDPRESAELVATLAGAVHAAHLRGVLHRDLKPANVLLSQAGSVGNGRERSVVPKITDFGLAKQLDGDRRLTHSGSFLGTPNYVAPEQCRGDGRAVGPPTDVYALGTILYEMLTGRVPFHGGDVLGLLIRVCEEEPVAPRRLRPSLPRDLEALVLCCLEKEPHRRYPSAANLADDLRRFLAGETVTARRPGGGERAWRWARRRPLVASLLGLLLVVTALGVAGVTAAMLHAFRGWDQAEQRGNDATAARDESRRLSARLTLERGIALAEARDVAAGLHWMLAAYDQAPDEGLRRAALINLTAWAAQSNERRHALSHTDEVWCVAYSPDSRSVVTGGADGRACLWDAETGELRFAVKTAGWVRTVAFHPDGQSFATGSGDFSRNAVDSRVVQFWDASTGAAVGAPLRHAQVIWTIAFHPGGKTLATGGFDGVVRLYDVASRRNIGNWKRPTPEVKCLAYSADGRWLASANEDRTICVWDVAAGKERHVLHGHQHVARCVAFHPDGRRLASCGSDCTVRLWDLERGKQLGEPWWHPRAVFAVAFTPDGGGLLSSCWDSHARLWDLATGQAGAPLRHKAEVVAVAVRPDGRGLATCSAAERVALLWSTSKAQSRSAPVTQSTPPPEVAPPDPATPAFTHAAFSPDARTVLSIGSQGLAQLWETETGRPLATLPHPHPVVRSLAFAPDGRSFATSSHALSTPDATLHRWDIRGRPLSRSVAANAVSALAFSPDGKTLAAGDYNAEVRLHDATNLKQVGPTLTQKDVVLSVAFSPDGKTLAAGTANERRRDPQARLWNVAKSEPIGQPLRHGHYVLSICFSPDGRTVLTGARDYTARLWDATTGEPRGAPLPHPRGWTASTFSPDGNSILTGGGDGVVRLWAVADGRPIGRPMTHRSEVRALAFSGDGTTVLAGCADGSARLWDAVLCVPLGPPVVQRTPVLAVRFAPHGRSFFTVAADGRPRQWPMPTPPADAAELAPRLQVATALEMDPAGQTVVPLELEVWQQRRRQLGQQPALGGLTLDAASWHEARARDAEEDDDPGTALWHLDRLAAARPPDWLLHARRGRAHIDRDRFDLADGEYRLALSAGGQDRLVAWYARRAAECRTRGRQAAARWYADRLPVAD